MASQALLGSEELRYTLNKAIKLPTGRRHLEDFIKVSFSDDMQLQITELCVEPAGFAINEVGEIIASKCVGCLLCVEEGEFESVDMNSVPTIDGGINLIELAKNCFMGRYYQYNGGDRFSNHSASDETKITNPMGAFYLVQLSHTPSSVYFSSSPSNECSINKSNVLVNREGHLDISLISTELRELFVLEGKKNVRGFINDRVRDQWNQYLPAINEIAEKFEINSTVCYLIGGGEVDMYPAGTGPKGRLHTHFRKVVDSDEKKFISLEALRAMKATKLTSNRDLSWEIDLIPLINRPDFVGLVTGGVIVREDGHWALKKAPWT